MLRCFWMLASISMAAIAQTPQVFPAGDGVTPARVVQKTAPEYTEAARQAKLEGTVGLRMIVNADGEPEDVYVMRPLGLGLDQEAVDAVRNWRFAPGMKDGRMVSVVTDVDVPFHLLAGRADWHLARVDFDLPPGTSLPDIEDAPYPAASGPERYDAVSLTFEIDAAGAPVNIRTAKSTDPKWEQALTEMLRNWRFRPATKDGVAVGVTATFDFARGRPATS